MSKWIVGVQFNGHGALVNRAVVLTRPHIHETNESIDNERKRIEIACLERLNHRCVVATHIAEEGCVPLMSDGTVRIQFKSAHKRLLRSGPIPFIKIPDSTKRLMRLRECFIKR